MCEHSQQQAREAGFLAMQFNSVVASNEVAVALWHRLGFETVGRLPKAYRHARLGLLGDHRADVRDEGVVARSSRLPQRG